MVDVEEEIAKADGALRAGEIVKGTAMASFAQEEQSSRSRRRS